MPTEHYVNSGHLPSLCKGFWQIISLTGFHSESFNSRILVDQSNGGFVPIALRCRHSVNGSCSAHCRHTQPANNKLKKSKWQFFCFMAGQIRLQPLSLFSDRQDGAPCRQSPPSASVHQNLTFRLLGHYACFFQLYPVRRVLICLIVLVDRFCRVT